MKLCFFRFVTLTPAFQHKRVSTVNGRGNPKNNLRLLCKLAFRLYAGVAMIVFHNVEFLNLCFKYGQ